MSQVKLTHRGGYRVLLGRVLISEHKTEREATEAAINVKLYNPAKTVRITTDYEADVELVDD